MQVSVLLLQNHAYLQLDEIIGIHKNVQNYLKI